MVKQENIMAKCHFSNYTAGQALQKKNSYKQQKKLFQSYICLLKFFRTFSGSLVHYKAALFHSAH